MNSFVQGTSRGGANVQEIVHRLELWGVNHLYVIGGNGGNAVRLWTGFARPCVKGLQ